MNIKDILYNIISTVWHMPLENRKIICYFHARSPDGRDLFTGCILYLGVSGSSPSLALSELRTKTKRKDGENIGKEIRYH